MSFVDVHDLYRLKGLLHRDISIFNMAFYRKPSGKVVGTLIDFDLAIYPEEAALPFIQVAVLVPEHPRASVTCNPTIYLNDDTQNQKPTADGDEMPQNGQDRSGTALFMALESLDLTTPNYKHHVCHELESIFYASVWHGVGYRHRRGILPRPPRRRDEETRQPDYLRKWRVGSWQEIMGAKDNFLSNPTPIAQLIKHGELRPNCQLLALLFRRRRDAARQASDAAVEEDTARQRALFRQGIISFDGLMKPALKYDLAVYPSYARTLGMRVVECKKECCVSILSNTS